MIETMPGGIAVFDYDGDGRPDIYFTNGADVPSLEKKSPKYWNRLYRNDGNLHFTDVTEKAGVAGAGYSMGAAAGDYDNDGHPDLFVAGVNRNILYRNRGDGTFEDVTAKAGITSDEWAVAAGWFDYDNDGKLDLLVVHYSDTPTAGPLLRRSRHECAHLLPSEIFQAAAFDALSQSRRRHVRGCLEEIGHCAVCRARHERRVRRLRWRRLDGRLRHQRQHAEFPVPQSRQRHVRRDGSAGRRRAAAIAASRSPAWAPIFETTITTACPTSP